MGSRAPVTYNVQRTSVTQHTTRTCHCVPFDLRQLPPSLLGMHAWHRGPRNDLGYHLKCQLEWIPWGGRVVIVVMVVMGRVIIIVFG